MKAARERKSVASVIRDKIIESPIVTVTRREKRVDILLRKLKKLAARNAKENKGINFTKEVIKMRYEQ